MKLLCLRNTKTGVSRFAAVKNKKVVDRLFAFLDRKKVVAAFEDAPMQFILTNLSVEFQSENKEACVKKSDIKALEKFLRKKKRDAIEIRNRVVSCLTSFFLEDLYVLDAENIQLFRKAKAGVKYPEEKLKAHKKSKDKKQSSLDEGDNKKQKSMTSAMALKLDKVALEARKLLKYVTIEGLESQIAQRTLCYKASEALACIFDPECFTKKESKIYGEVLTNTVEDRQWETFIHERYGKKLGTLASSIRLMGY